LRIAGILNAAYSIARLHRPWYLSGLLGALQAFCRYHQHHPEKEDSKHIHKKSLLLGIIAFGP
jgi:hypothetical protein